MAILNAAIDEFIDRGLAAMTIEGVATRAGVARSTVYRRWSSTTDLCMDALEHIRGPAPEPPGGDIRDDLIFLMRSLRHLLTGTRLGRLIPQLAAEAHRQPELSRRYWTDYLVRGNSGFGQVLRRGVADGQLRGDLDLELTIDLLTGPLFKRALWQLELTDEDIGRLVDTVLAGLTPAT